MKMPTHIADPIADTNSAPRKAGRAMALSDMFAFKRLSDPQMSPDGETIAYTVTTVVDPDTNKTTTNIWLRPSAGGAARRLTSTDKHDCHPRWSPDGTQILFESDRSGQSQLWVIDVGGGEARQVTTIATGAGTGIWSHDGKLIAFVSAVFPEYSRLPCAESDKLSRKRLEEAEKSPVKARVLTKLFYRHWDSWTDGKRLHIFVMPAPGQGERDPLDVTPGDADAYPTSMTFEMGDDYTFSPDGNYIVYTAPPLKDEATSTNYAIYRVPAGGGEPQCLTAGNPAASGGPRFSPDGTRLAYRAQRRPGYESDCFEIMVAPTDAGGGLSGKPESITAGTDLSAGQIAWLDDDTILFTAHLLGTTPIFAVPLDGRGVITCVDGQANGSISTSALGRSFAFERSSLFGPPAICAAEYYCPDTGDGYPFSRQVSDENHELTRQIDFGRLQGVYVGGAGGAEMQMWMIMPPGFDPTKKWPLALLVHGGPQSAWDDAWSWRWNAALWAAQGYVVACPNFHGSTGFGEAYKDAISRDWGGKCFDDLMAGVAYLEQLPYIDADRMAAAGASFGGYMMNWFQGHTDKFKCLITHCGCYNLESMIATEEQWFPEWEYGGQPWNSDDYLKFSPHRYTQSFKTPNLIVHNELDFRVPIGQGLELFNALQLLGVPSRMIVFPDEGHWVLKPANSILWHNEVFDWLKQYAPAGPR